MSSFILSTEEGSKTIASISISEGYTFSPKKQIGQYVKVKKVSIYDSEIIGKIVIRQYTNKYTRLANIINDLVTSDDTNEGDFMICLDEIEKLKSILCYKYQNALKRKMFEYFLNDLVFLEKVINERLIEFKTNKIFEVGGR